jgi:hypothetical protein
MKPRPIASGAARSDAHQMTLADSALDADQIARARALLDPPQQREQVWPVLAAAAFLAVSALAFATAMILEPPLQTEHVTAHRPAK